jgi:hypothetical protein
MKRIFFICMMSLFCSLVMTVSTAQAQYAYYYTDVQYVPQYRYVDGYTSTWLDYYAGLYYDPAVLGELYRTDMNENPLDQGYHEGYADWIDAEVYLFTRNYVEGKTYCTSGVHFLIDAYTGQRSTEQTFYPCITISIQTPTPPPSPRPVTNVQSVDFQTINSPVLTGAQGNPGFLGGGSRIFPDKLSPDDSTNMRIVRVVAQLTQPVSGVRVYFRNFDVDDPSPDPIIDDNGNLGNDNRQQRGTPGSAGVLSAPSALSDASGIAVIDFTVTMFAGDNFVISASTDETYSNGIGINGTELQDSAGDQLPTTRANRTPMLSVWRKIHLEVDTMGYVGNNLTNGYIQSKGSVDEQTPVWVNIYSSTGPLEVGRFRGGRLALGPYNLRVIDNTVDRVQVRSESGTVLLRVNQIYALFDDDDFNNDDGVLQNGDDQEDVTWRCLNNVYPCDIPASETFSRLRPSTNIAENPYAAAYIEPNYSWAQQQPGMNDTLTQFYLNVPLTPPNYETERGIIDQNRDSIGMERDDFWIGHLLVGYQGDTPVDVDSELAAVGGVAPPVNYQTAWTNSVMDSLDVTRGSLTAIIYIEVMRDWDATAFADFRVRTAPHELGHQFGLLGDSSDPAPLPNWGIMSADGPLEFVPTHINVMRWRIDSPGEN